MVDLGFRPPEFSEDLAWVPAWLQPNNQLEESYDNPNSSKQDTCLRENGCEGKGLNLLAEDWTSNGFRLVLTGEENSPESLSALSGSVPHLHLYLSTCSISQDKNDLFLSRSQLHSISDLDLGAHSIDNVVGARLIRRSDGECEHNSANLPLISIPKSVKSVDGKPMKSDDSRMLYGEGFDMNSLKADNVEDAIELSIAASEALVIHEMAKHDSDAEDTLLASVLELSLRVKQARIEGLKDASPERIYQNDENDSLPVLDDIVMAEAFEDVGLKCSSRSIHLTEKSVVLPVQDAPASEYRSTHISEANFHENPTQRKSEETLVINNQLFDGVLLETYISELPDRKSPEETLVIDDHLFRDIHLESSMSELPEKHLVNPSWNVHTTNGPTCASPEFPPLSLANMDDNAIDKLANSSKMDVITSQHEGCVETPPRELGDDGENEEAQLASSGYTSRWFGGWGMKDFTVRHLEVDPRRAVKFFVRETSTLSESVDVAPDENSVIQAQENGPDELSQSSKYTKGSCNMNRDGQLLSQDIVGSSSLSPDDPLCSFVPCSITSADLGYNLSQNNCEREVNIGECKGLSSDSRMENLQENLNTNVEHVSLGAEALPPGFQEYPRTTARKHLTSLKDYSMLLPKNNPLSNEKVISTSWPLLSECSRDLHYADQGSVYKKSLSNEGSVSFLSFKPKSGFAAEYNAESTIVPQKRCQNETVIDEVEKHFEPLKGKKSPVIIDCQSCIRLQASEPFNDDLTREKISVPVLEAQTLPEFQKNKDFQDIPSEHNTRKNTPKPTRKRVHFADTVVELQDITDQKGPQISHKNVRASKRSRRSYPLQESGSHDGKRHCKTRAYTNKKRLILRGIEFLLTGFSVEKRNNIEDLIRKCGGIVLHDIPPPPNSRTKNSSRYILPIILCSKKLQTTTFLYACAVNAFILRVDWLFDSVAEGLVQSSAKYMIIENRLHEECSQIGMPIRLTKQQYIFDSVGIMLQGSNVFCTKFEKVFKHGGGKVFKTLRGLVGSLDAGRISAAALVVQYEAKPLRHLKHFASEKKIPVSSCSWIVDSLHKGKLLPLTTNNYSCVARPKILKFAADIESSQEI